jgi:hypothetical protein
VHARIPVADHVRRERWLQSDRAQWGPAPGKLQSDGASIHVLGERFGNVFVGIQPGMGYEGDPMRLLFEKGFAPTHAFSAFYRWLREDFGAHAVLHFGTHGALEFMPGKQNGMTASCWPDRMIGDLPNFYLYASNNPSEGTIAKRRAAATLISYLTPPTSQAGLYKGLVDLKAAIERFRSLEPEAERERTELAAMIQAQAAALDLARASRPGTPLPAAAGGAPGGAGAGAGIHADPARPARGGLGAHRGAARGPAHVAGRGLAGPAARPGHRASPGGGPVARVAGWLRRARRTPRPPAASCSKSWPATTVCWRRTTNCPA